MIFVGSNPSVRGPDCKALENLKRWQKIMGLELHQTTFTNVSWKTTPKNRPLKRSEYELSRLFKEVYEHEHVVALGRTASQALTILEVDHFVLPHPSPKNRVLNDKALVEHKLLRCKEYLNGRAETLRSGKDLLSFGW